MKKRLITTHRLYLREFLSVDAEGMYLLNSDEEVLKYAGDQPFDSLAAAVKFINEYNHYELFGMGRWAVILHTTHEFIGWCGLKQHNNGEIDLGFRFMRKYWNQGYATEAAQVCLLYGFETLNIPRIIGRASVANHASRRVLEKIGMKFWKNAPIDGIGEGTWYEKFANNIQ